MSKRNLGVTETYNEIRDRLVNYIKSDYFLISKFMDKGEK